MRSGWILKIGEMFFVSYIGKRLMLTSDAKEAWFTQDCSLAENTAGHLHYVVEIPFVVAHYTHAEKVS